MLAEQDPGIRNRRYPKTIDLVTSILDEEWRRPWISGNIIARNLEKESRAMIKELGRAPLPTQYGDWTYIVFGDYTHGNHHEMLVYGNLEKGSLGNGENLLVRMHSSCHTNEIFGATNCECRAQLQLAMEKIAEESRGIVIYLEQEGRGNGIAGKLAQLNGMFGWDNGVVFQKRDKTTGDLIDTNRAYAEAGYPSESRDFTVVGEMLKGVGVKSVRLLTNNPQKISGVESSGIAVEPVEIHITPKNETIAADLRSKAKNLGHHITEEHLIMRKNSE